LGEYENSIDVLPSRAPACLLWAETLSILVKEFTRIRVPDD